MSALTFRTPDGIAMAETYDDGRPATLTFPRSWPRKEIEQHTEAMFWLSDRDYADRIVTRETLSDGRTRQTFNKIAWPSV
jgi:hypothetical protein